MLTAAIARAQSACQRASFGLVNRTLDGKWAVCPNSNTPNANASPADTSIRPPDNTVAARGASATIATIANAAIPTNVAFSRHHIRTLSSVAARLFTKTGQ
jgi:hypothetical protein